MSKTQQGSANCLWAEHAYSGATPGDPKELNLSQEFAGTIMDQIIEYKCQEWARNEALIQWEQELVD